MEILPLTPAVCEGVPEYGGELGEVVRGRTTYEEIAKVLFAGE